MGESKFGLCPKCPNYAQYFPRHAEFSLCTAAWNGVFCPMVETAQAGQGQMKVAPVTDRTAE